MNRQVDSGLAAAGVPEIKPVQIVVLVDESGSISADDMRQEQSAAGLIAQAEFSPKSSVAVVGFGSDDGGAPPVDVVCQPIVVAGATERQHLSNCVSQLHKRAPGHGDNTDHVQALNQALSYLGSPDDTEPKIVFLLTDGVLDVSASTRYGAHKTPQQRNEAAAALLTDSIGQARRDHVEIWPLGFGHLDRHALDNFASGSYQGSCGAGSPTPSATVVANSADVDDAVLRAYSAARCAGTPGISNKQLSAGQHIDMTVTIPPIATDGSIIVIKRDARIDVAYFDPSGRQAPLSGDRNGSSFEDSGATGPVEALRIINPQPGSWRVRITSPAGVPAQTISSTVAWQGAVQASLVTNPPSPSAGQLVTVSLQLHLRGGRPVTDPAILRGLSFTAELTAGGSDRMPIPLADNGKSPDRFVDGTYTGQVRIPADAVGTVTFQGHVHGIGITGDDPSATATITAGLPSLLVSAQLPGIDNQVAPGGTLPATMQVTNNSGRRVTVRVLVEQQDGSAITIPPGKDTVHELPASGNNTFTFDLAFAGNSRLGPTSGVIDMVDDAHPATVYDQEQFTVDVGYPAKFPWLPIIGGVLAAIVLIGGVVALLRGARSLRERDVRGLVAYVSRGGRTASLPAGPQRSTAFRFTVDREGDVPPTVHHADVVDPDCYVLTRSRGHLRLLPLAAEPIEFEVGATRSIEDDAEIRVVDELRQDDVPDTPTEQPDFAYQPPERNPWL